MSLDQAIAFIKKFQFTHTGMYGPRDSCRPSDLHPFPISSHSSPEYQSRFCKERCRKSYTSDDNSQDWDNAPAGTRNAPRATHDMHSSSSRHRRTVSSQSDKMELLQSFMSGFVDTIFIFQAYYGATEEPRGAFLAGKITDTRLEIAQLSRRVLWPLPVSQNRYEYILTLVDLSTRWAEGVPLRHISAKDVAQSLFDLFCRLGFPCEIQSDRGQQFMSQVLREFNSLTNIKHFLSSPYHPQTNGVVERFHSTLKGMLRKLAFDSPSNWCQYLNAALFAYRCQPRSPTKDAFSGLGPPPEVLLTVNGLDPPVALLIVNGFNPPEVLLTVNSLDPPVALLTVKGLEPPVSTYSEQLGVRPAESSST
ncbi:hypothetical protein PoB_004447300 [Plakobranchus ocellatus]|uniref:Integrase catalytic domain-containing protein n=1 Tax=Plakobranchus ocellatus TaxID=259542 RepID=A0AAV4BGK0_9GAST|nr:hypothetical protein PoB_004447300 [Plakobranchus ocellatus]